MVKLLQLLYFLVSISLILSTNISDDREVPFDININETINDFLTNLSDPVVITDLVFMETDSTLLRGILNISKLSMEGVNNIVASKIDITPDLSYNVTLEIPSLTLYSIYRAGLVFQKWFPIYGEGIINVYLDKASLTVTGKADLSEKIPSIVNTTLMLHLEKAKVNFDGLYNNPELNSLLTILFNDNFVTFVNEHGQAFSKLVSPVFEYFVNRILNYLQP